MSQASEITCSNCHSRMPSDLRFCRNCGFRLPQSMAGYGVGQHSPSGELPIVTAVPASKKKRRMTGMSWIFVALLVFFVGAAAFTAIVAPMEKHGNGSFVQMPVVKSYIGVDGFDNTDDGVIFKAVKAPDGPADKAGLVGGDVIVSFDGQPIHDEDQLNDIMTQTPIGKTVDVEYMRDGQKKTAKLTTISDEENRRLTREFDRRQDKAQFGYEDGDAKTVKVPGTNIHGVRLGTILRNRPADIAGVKEGDIVIQFDDIPIRTDAEFLMRVRRAQPYTTVKLVVMRPKGDPEAQDQPQQFEKLEIPV